MELYAHRRHYHVGYGSDSESIVPLSFKLHISNFMSIHVAFLRAVNVGGRNLVPMSELCDLFFPNVEDRFSGRY